MLVKSLEQTLAKNTPYDAMARELITASGPSFDAGGVNFILRYRSNPVDLAGGVSRVFLGIRLQCAQCHDHPFAAWKQQQFWGMAAFFARTKLYYIEDLDSAGVVEVKRGGRMATPGLKTGEEPKGEDEEPESARIAPVYLDGRPAGAEWRVSLAEAITDPARSPTFALNAINRVWASMFGKGLVEPLDGFTLKETGEPPALLRELADAFVKKRYDLHWLLSTIATSRAYQKGAGAPVRPLDEDQLVDAIRDATGFHEEPELDEGEEEDMNKEEMADAMEEAEAYQEEEAGDLFGAQAVSQTRALALLNSTFIHEAVDAGAQLCKAGNGRKIGPRHIEWLYLATLSRRPAPEEIKQMEELLAGSPAKGAKLEDILWALLNSAEFTSNH